MTVFYLGVKSSQSFRQLDGGDIRCGIMPWVGSAADFREPDESSVLSTKRRGGFMDPYLAAILMENGVLCDRFAQSLRLCQFPFESARSALCPVEHQGSGFSDDIITLVAE